MLKGSIGLQIGLTVLTAFVGPLLAGLVLEMLKKALKKRNKGKE